jgi:hypothetical protein
MESANQEREVSKAEFKKLYFTHASPNSGWTEDYWNNFFEKEENKKYFFTAPDSPLSTQLFIISDSSSQRMVFLTEDATESFFDNPNNGK